ncbi:hypothetical protein MRB53_039497 [Persea americana]|nr:hypothetical protein MRB53_039497 [Persea americana]
MLDLHGVRGTQGIILQYLSHWHTVGTVMLDMTRYHVVCIFRNDLNVWKLTREDDDMAGRGSCAALLRCCAHIRPHDLVVVQHVVKVNPSMRNFEVTREMIAHLTSNPQASTIAKTDSYCQALSSI